MFTTILQKQVEREKYTAFKADKGFALIFRSAGKFDHQKLTVSYAKNYTNPVILVAIFGRPKLKKKGRYLSSSLSLRV